MQSPDAQYGETWTNLYKPAPSRLPHLFSRVPGLVLVSLKSMITQFQEPAICPPGFRYYADFLSAQEEAYLIDTIQALDLQPFRFRGFEAERRVTCCGYDYHFNSRTAGREQAIPPPLLPLVQRTSLFLMLKPGAIAEVIVSQYPGGSGINRHHDTPPSGIVAAVSLHDNCRFGLHPRNRIPQSREQSHPVYVHRRSLYVLDDGSGNDRDHRISPIPESRYSITMRAVRSAQNS